MDYTCRETIKMNMKDFGCEDQIIEEFLKKFDSCDIQGQKKILKDCREELLDELHRNQKNIDLLDYMVYQLDKCNCKCEGDR